MRTFSLRPIQENVRTQIKSTNDILEAIESLYALQGQLQGPDKEAFLATLEKLNKISSSLMDNAENTSKFIREVAG